MRFSRVVAGMIMFGFTLLGATQEDTVAKAGAAYEVISIKPSKPGTPGGVATLPNGFRDTDTTIDNVFRNAFGIFYDKQIIGLPQWTQSDLYDVEAKVDTETAARWQKLTSGERRKEEQPMMQGCSLIDASSRFTTRQRNCPYTI